MIRNGEPTPMPTPMAHDDEHTSRVSSSTASRINDSLASNTDSSDPSEKSEKSSIIRISTTRSNASQHALPDVVRLEIQVSYLYQQQRYALWVTEATGDREGIYMRDGQRGHLTYPPELHSSAFARGCLAIGVRCAITVNTPMMKILSRKTGITGVPFSNGRSLQIIPNLDCLGHAKKLHLGALVAREGILVAWCDNPMQLMAHAQEMEQELYIHLAGGQLPQEESDEKKPQSQIDCVEVDAEQAAVEEVRKTNLVTPVLVSCTLAVVVTMLGAGWRQIALQIKADGNYFRLLFLLLVPIQIFFTLFFAQVIIGCLAQIFGPVSQMDANSRFFSGKRPARRLAQRPLPHVTIQCPVYKEGLHSVIAPTVYSIKAAMSTYELQGGTANLFINDDGLQLLDEESRNARIEFYAENNIGWTARPSAGPYFPRRGKFKKASNMNFGLMLSHKVEQKLEDVFRHSSWSQRDEALEYERCLTETLEDLDQSHGWLAWADGNIRMGDYILLIDSDTRVPADCLLDAVSEMEQSPDVGILQFSSGVMQVTDSWFEDGIAFFTNLIYTSIRYTVSNGDVAPFVGHNAILRWPAIQEIGYFDPRDGYEKFWSEDHVSEDFEMSLKLQCAGYTIRMASWAGIDEGFLEGVSLTVHDEVARWSKYAYGCNELLFHPIRKWIWKGPFTPLFRKFLTSNIRFTSKISIIAYIGTYYAIGAAWIMTLANYFAVGWFLPLLDQYYIDSWKVWFAIVIVFNGLGNLALAIMRYRIKEKGLLSSLLENLMWTIPLAIFLGGLSLHVSQALLAHMFEINMSWGATSKEAEVSNFFIEAPRVLKQFKWSIGFAVFAIVLIVVLAVDTSIIPRTWNITDFIAIVPMATIAGSHLLLPIVLNPALMTFKF